MFLNRSIFPFIIFWLAAFFNANAQFGDLTPEQQKPQSYVIVDISVQGNKYSDAETIIALSGLRRGMQITVPGDEQIPNAIKNLWQRRQFSDIDIVVDKITSFGIFLVIKVSEYPRLSYIKVEDNDKISQDDIRKAIGKMRGDIITPYDVYLAKKDVKKLYDDEDMMFAKVDTKLEETDTSYYAVLDVKVDEGTEFDVTKISFEGNTHFTDDELASEFDDTHTKHWWQFWRSAKFDLKEYDADKKLLLDFYQKNGYIDAEIVKDSIHYDDDNEAVQIDLTVFEGNKYYIRNIDFEGNTVYPDGLLLQRLQFHKGEVYNKERFNKNLYQNEDQTDVISLYLDNGYLQANMQVDEKRVSKDSVDLVINVIEKDRVKIRMVEIAGNTKTKDKVIRRELYTRPGDYFSRSAIIRSIRALGVMNYFNPEALQKPPDIVPVGTDNTQVDLVYHVEERSTDTFNASIGYAGIYGITGAIGFTFNNFSLLEPLKGGAGQIFNFNWEFGQWSNNFHIGFTEPWLFDEPNTVGFNIYDSRFRYGYNMRRTGFSVNFGRRFKWPDDYWRGDWSFMWQKNDIGANLTGYYSLWRPGKTTEITLTQAFSRISFNNLFFPTSGSKFSLSFAWAMGAIGIGNTDYLKSGLKYETVAPLMKIGGIDKLALYLSADLGYVDGIEVDTTIPPIDLFLMGGNGLSTYTSITPMRGYEDRTIGPRNGGRVMSRYVAEVRFAISQDPMPIYVYGFAEAGNVWDKFSETDPFNLKRSAGIGVQLMINPIGVIGFSYGYGFDPVQGGDKPSGWKFLFHLGQQ